MTGIATTWSHRRAAVAAEAAAEARAELELLDQKKREELAEKSDEDILEELGLPDPDSLGLGDDFKGFMAKTVPNHIRKRALRKLWRSNPVLACVDGLNDYDDDYLTGSVGQGAIKTSYQVGKGMLAHLLEIERQKDAIVPVVVEEPEDEDAQPEIEVASDVAIDPTVTSDACVDEEPQAIAPRRMQFQFKGDTA